MIIYKYIHWYQKMNCKKNINEQETVHVLLQVKFYDSIS